MLDVVVIIRAPCPPGRRAVPKAGGTAGLWRGSRPGEQLCGLEAAGAPWEGGAVTGVGVRCSCTYPPRSSFVFFFFFGTHCTTNIYTSPLIGLLTNVLGPRVVTGSLQYVTVHPKKSL